ncbi:DUF234 domain-containing protein, partial [Cetobacterium sp.]
WDSTIPFPIKSIGRWWDKNEEIDVVALGEKEILFGECKWSNKHVGLSVLFKLQEKAKKVDKKGKKEFYILFSKSGFSEELIEYSKVNSNILLSNF